QEVVDALGRLVGIQALTQLGILGGHAHRTAPRVAVVAVAGLDPDRPLVVSLGDVFVAVERDHRRSADRHGVGAQRQRLGHVRTGPDAAGVDQADLSGLAHVVEGLARLADGGDAWDPRLLGGDVGAGARRAFHAVEVDAVWAGLGRHPDVVVDPRRPEL